MSTNPSTDHSSLSSFTFPDGRRCRTPRRAGHPYLCAFHARKLWWRVFRPASAMAASAPVSSRGQRGTCFSPLYLGQTLVQNLHLAQHEYINAYGSTKSRVSRDESAKLSGPLLARHTHSCKYFQSAVRSLGML